MRKHTQENSYRDGSAEGDEPGRRALRGDASVVERADKIAVGRVVCAGSDGRDLGGAVGGKGCQAREAERHAHRWLQGGVVVDLLGTWLPARIAQVGAQILHHNRTSSYGGLACFDELTQGFKL